MIQLRPQEYFAIVRGLENHTDSTTYYVQSVIRNARTDELIDTVNLEEKASRRFSKAWQVPADTSGEGFYISIETSIYTNSGYTTKSDNYGDSFDTYLIQDRLNVNSFGGAGSEVDYEKIRKIIKKYIDQIPTPERPDDIDYSHILNSLVAINDSINKIEIPEQHELDLRDIVVDIKSIQRAIRKLPEPATTESLAQYTLEAVQSELRPVEARLTATYEAFLGNINDIGGKIDKQFGNFTKKIKELKAQAVKKKEPKKEEKPKRKIRSFMTRDINEEEKPTKKVRKFIR